jgi:Family of unknown function (DUF6338)
VVPATVGGVVTLVLLVLPGLAFELMRQRRRWGRGDSTFIEISRVLVAGLSLGGITYTVLAGISVLGPQSIVSLPGLFTNKSWLLHHLLVAGWTAWAYGLVSVTLAALAAVILPSANAAGSIQMESSWVTCFERLPRAIQEAQRLQSVPDARLSVRLNDGTVYVGNRAEYSGDLPSDDRELVLTGPLIYLPPGKPATDAKPLHQWQRLIIRGGQINDILVQYIPNTKTTKESPPDTSRLRRARGICAMFLGRPLASNWKSLLEAPASYASATLRLLAAEIAILVLVAIASRFM